MYLLKITENSEEETKSIHPFSKQLIQAGHPGSWQAEAFVTVPQSQSRNITLKSKKLIREICHIREICFVLMHCYPWIGKTVLCDINLKAFVWVHGGSGLLRVTMVLFSLVSKKAQAWWHFFAGSPWRTDTWVPLAQTGPELNPKRERKREWAGEGAFHRCQAINNLSNSAIWAWINRLTVLHRNMQAAGHPGKLLSVWQF